MPVIDQIFVYDDSKHDFAIAIYPNYPVVKWVLNEMKERASTN